MDGEMALEAVEMSMDKKYDQHPLERSKDASN